MLALALAAAFGLELMALVAFGLWGAQLGQNALTQALFSIGTPLLVAIFWGVFLSPKAAVPLASPFQLVLKLVVFAFATAALVAAGYVVLSVAFGSLAVT